MQVVNYWIAKGRDGAENLVRTYTERTQVYNADGTVAKQITEEDAKAWKSKAKKERNKK
jgi:hypothetical protein